MNAFTQTAFGDFESTHWRSLAVWVAGLVYLFGLGTQSVMAKGGDACKASAKAASQACAAEAKADFALASGKCANLTDLDARKACLEQAKADMKDALDGCKEQFDARQTACEGLGSDPYDPVIAPSNFVGAITNQFMPLTPGTSMIYTSQTTEGAESNVVTVTSNTRVILGVTCVEVHDVVFTDGVLTEDTLDWFAQDKDGNVWYFGENSKELEDGLVVSLEGSWTAGVDGAKPGIVMKATPALNDFYRQEFALGTAEDLAQVTGLDESVTVPAGSFVHCLKTDETTPLEPDALEHKFYAAGVGLVLTDDESAGEHLVLVQVITSP